MAEMPWWAEPLANSFFEELERKGGSDNHETIAQILPIEEIHRRYPGERRKCRHRPEIHTSAEPVAAGLHVESYLKCAKCGEILGDKAVKNG